MTAPSELKNAIKNGRWLASGLIAGVAIGLVIGISISKIIPSTNDSAIESSKSAALALGWDELNKVYESSKVFDSTADSGAISNLEKALASSYAKLNDSKFKSLSGGQKTVASNTTDTPKPEKPIQNNIYGINKNGAASNGKYAEGSGPIDINTATIQQIDDIPRMSTSTAKDIYDYIHSKGPIKSFLELDSIKNVGDKTIEKLQSAFHIKK